MGFIFCVACGVMYCRGTIGLFWNSAVLLEVVLLHRGRWFFKWHIFRSYDQFLGISLTSCF